MREPTRATVRSGVDWRASPSALARATSLDVTLGPGREVSLLPFEFDPVPIARWRYDACVAETVCPPRDFPQPAVDGPDAPAVGMHWEHANRFCEARGMRAQSPEQDRAIRDSGGVALGPARLNAGNDDEHVLAGFRCTRQMSTH
jgi:hypothetical protein